MHDIVLAYSASDSPVWNQQYEPPSESTLKTWGEFQQELDPSGTKKIKTTRKSPGVPMRDVWPIKALAAASKERTGYPTQKPLALLERIIRASSNPDDVVFDPFCGCATTLVAAEKLGRQWIGCDLSDLAVRLVKQRIKRELGGLLFDVHHRSDIPHRTDIGKLPPARNHAHRLYGEQEGVCAGCLTHFPFRVMQVDHRIPQAKGGTDHYDNLQMLCSGCNLRKGTGTQEELRVKLRRDGIID